VYFFFSLIIIQSFVIINSFQVLEMTAYLHTITIPTSELTLNYRIMSVSFVHCSLRFEKLITISSQTQRHCFLVEYHKRLVVTTITTIACITPIYPMINPQFVNITINSYSLNSCPNNPGGILLYLINNNKVPLRSSNTWVNRSFVF